MTRKRCHRKHYALVNPIALAIEGAGVTAKADLDRLRVLELSAIEAFAKGRATTADWRALADMMNVCETMASNGVGPEALEACQRLQEALGAAIERHQAHGRPAFDGPGLQAARDTFEYHDLQRQSISRSEYERAIKRTADRIRSAAPDVKVCIE